MDEINHGDDAIAREIIQLMQASIVLFKQNCDVLIQPFGISTGQQPLLCLLLEEDGLSQKELAARLNVTPASITTMLGRMEKANLVFRKRNEADKRASKVFLTKHGLKMSQKITTLILHMNAQVLTDFRPDEKIVIFQMLQRLKKSLEAQKRETET